VTLSVRQRTISYYVLTALSTLGSAYYFNYLFFFLHDQFGFGNQQNLWVSALHGLIYVFSAWQGGRFAERRGNHLSLRVGFGSLTACMVAAALSDGVRAQILIVAIYSVVLLFIWPALEALTIAEQPPERVPHMVGIYNCTWSGAMAVSYFTGGTLYDTFGHVAVFWIPAALFGAQFAFALRFLPARTAATTPSVRGRAPDDRVPDSRPETVGPVDRAGPDAGVRSAAPAPPVHPRTFLRLAWIANPFSYVAVYTLLAVMPGLAGRLGLSPTEIGIYGSIWFFGRLAAFVTLWQWTGWHYRFRWLTAAYVLLSVSFVAVVSAPALWVFVAGEIVFGLSTGLIYYSSLFYSMDVGDAKAEHGGLHEAAIGAGIFAGPAIGGASLQFFPQSAAASTIGVSVLLVVGLLALVGVWTSDRKGLGPEV
jgi:predicted MFS family arabinose efflux permease